MKEKNKLENLLVQLSDLLLLVRQHKGPINEYLTPEAQEYLEHLKKLITQFDELNQQEFKAAGVDIEKLKEISYRSKDISEKDKRFLDKARQIEKEARVFEHQIKAVLQPSAKQKITKTSSSKKRQKRFKSMGGNKGWIPL